MLIIFFGLAMIQSLLYDEIEFDKDVRLRDFLKSSGDSGIV